MAFLRYESRLSGLDHLLAVRVLVGGCLAVGSTLLVFAAKRHHCLQQPRQQDFSFD